MRVIAIALSLLVVIAAPAAAKKRKAKKPVAPTAALSCSVDSDCELTRYADGECCPMLCQPRAVAKASAAALAKYGTECKQKCAAPPCPPPQRVMTASCVAGKCALAPVPRNLTE